MLKFKPGEFAYLYYSQLIVIVGPVCNAVRLSFSAGFASAGDLIKSPSLSPSLWWDLSLRTGRNSASWSPGDRGLLGVSTYLVEADALRLLVCKALSMTPGLQDFLVFAGLAFRLEVTQTQRCRLTPVFERCPGKQFQRKEERQQRVHCEAGGCSRQLGCSPEGTPGATLWGTL